MSEHIQIDEKALKDALKAAGIDKSNYKKYPQWEKACAIVCELEGNGRKPVTADSTGNGETIVERNVQMRPVIIAVGGVLPDWMR